MKKILTIASMMIFFIQNNIFATSSSSLHNNYKNLLENTIWLVPPSTLLAFSYSADGYTPTSDQTVWVIDGYEGSYFFGHSYTVLGGSTFSKRNLLGTITNEGRVYITFYTEGDASASTDLINGIGTFEKTQGVYQFTMQMNSGDDTSGVSHWSYMINAEDNPKYYNQLPGTTSSVPEFLEQFD